MYPLIFKKHTVCTSIFIKRYTVYVIAKLLPNVRLLYHKYRLSIN